MILIDKLKEIFTSTEIITVHENSLYGYTINILKPTRLKPYHIVFTNGLSTNAQNITEKHIEFKHIELYFCLPEYWNPKDMSEANQWPIYWLDKIASIPQKNGSWFGPGDTIPAGNPPKAISDKLVQNHFILAEPMLFEKTLKNVQLDNKIVKFFAVIPLFEIEQYYKMHNSAKWLMAKYQYKKYNELVDEYRAIIFNKYSGQKLYWLILKITSLFLIIFLIYRFFDKIVDIFKFLFY